MVFPSPYSQTATQRLDYPVKASFQIVFNLQFINHPTIQPSDATRSAFQIRKINKESDVSFYNMHHYTTITTAKMYLLFPEKQVLVETQTAKSSFKIVKILQIRSLFHFCTSFPLFEALSYNHNRNYKAKYCIV